MLTSMNTISFLLIFVDLRFDDSINFTFQLVWQFLLDNDHLKLLFWIENG